MGVADGTRGEISDRFWGRAETMAWWKIWGRNGGDGRGPDYYEEGVQLARRGLYHDALTSFRLALKARPTDPATLEQIAVIYTHIGLQDEAVRAYGTALELRPASPSAHYGLAFLLLKTGAELEAMEHLKAFLANARDPEEAKHLEHARRTLERLGASAGEPAAR